MVHELEQYKGIHPGAVLERILKKRNISQRSFALSLPEHPQTLNGITKGKRDLNVALSLKIEKTLGLEEGSMMMLQVCYNIKKEKEKQDAAPKPDLSKLRKALFWDTSIQKIDWQRHADFAISRIWERGNDTEKAVLRDFYGAEKIKEVLERSALTGDKLLLMPHLKKD